MRTNGIARDDTPSACHQRAAASDPVEPLGHFRTVWISDLHLGSRGAQAEEVLAFLKRCTFDKLYLVGDVLDIWKLRRSRYWPQTHTDVLQRILKLARDGTEVVYIPGNHDDFCANFLGAFGNIRIVENDLHTTAAGRRLLVMHGHEFDGVTRHARWVAILGDMGYEFLLLLNRGFNAVRRTFGWGYWSLSAYVKARVKDAVNLVGDYEHAVARYARLHRADGIVCGHIHTAAARRMHGIEYYNTGDWVESCTALLEDAQGRLSLVRWFDLPAPVHSHRPRHAPQHRSTAA